MGIHHNRGCMRMGLYHNRGACIRAPQQGCMHMGIHHNRGACVWGFTTTGRCFVRELTPGLRPCTGLYGSTKFSTVLSHFSTMHLYFNTMHSHISTVQSLLLIIRALRSEWPFINIIMNHTLILCGIAHITQPRLYATPPVHLRPIWHRLAVAGQQTRTWGPHPAPEHLHAPPHHTAQPGT